MRKHGGRLVLPTLVLTLALVAAACGGSDNKSSTATTQAKESITMAAFNFSESAILALWGAVCAAYASVGAPPLKGLAPQPNSIAVG